MTVSEHGVYFFSSFLIIAQPQELEQRRAALLATIKGNTPTKTSKSKGSGSAASSPLAARATSFDFNTPVKQAAPGATGDVFMSGGSSGYPGVAQSSPAPASPLQQIKHHAQAPGFGSAAGLPGQYDQQQLLDQQRLHRQFLYDQNLLSAQYGFGPVRPGFNAPGSAFAPGGFVPQNPALHAQYPFAQYNPAAQMRTPEFSVPPTPPPASQDNQVEHKEPAHVQFKMDEVDKTTLDQDEEVEQTVEGDQAEQSDEEAPPSESARKLDRQAARLALEGITEESLSRAQNLRFRYDDLTRSERNERRAFAGALFEVIKDSLNELLDQFD